jgi:hypothetical protein
VLGQSKPEAEPWIDAGCKMALVCVSQPPVALHGKEPYEGTLEDLCKGCNRRIQMVDSC